MNTFNYYIIDYVLVDYVGDGEGVNQLRILRSRRPQSVRLDSGGNFKKWVQENEELCERAVYADGAWNVKTWESVYYVDELADYKITIDNVVKITRVIDYEMK
jgi:hypothetical protein